MTNFSGPLRVARAEVIPQIPSLAPQLLRHPQVIRQALRQSFAASGKDPNLVPRYDWNKTERHAIVGFGIREQISYLVEGEGKEAHFKDFKTNPDGRRSLEAFLGDFAATQAAGAEYVEETFSKGNDAEHRWWRRAEFRYWWLGEVSHLTSKAKREIPREGRLLSAGLRTRAPSMGLERYLSSMAELAVPKEERIKAAYDLPNMLTAFAGLHLMTLLGMNVAANITISPDKAGIYRPFCSNTDEVRKDRQSIPKPFTAQLKCPAHTPSRESSAPDDKVSTSLQNLIFAAIRESTNYDIF